MADAMAAWGKDGARIAASTQAFAKDEEMSVELTAMWHPGGAIGFNQVRKNEFAGLGSLSTRRTS